MATIIPANTAKPQTPEDPFMTKAQIREKYKVTDFEIAALEHLGFLIRICLDRKAKRYWRSDVEAGVHAHRNGLPAPAPTYKKRIAIKWEV